MWLLAYTVVILTPASYSHTGAIVAAETAQMESRMGGYYATKYDCDKSENLLKSIMELQSREVLVVSECRYKGLSR